MRRVKALSVLSFVLWASMIFTILAEVSLKNGRPSISGVIFLVLASLVFWSLFIRLEVLESTMRDLESDEGEK